MYRKITEKLERWKRDENKKALLVSGARQIGKTYSIREFGKREYENFVEINFITEPLAKEIFNGNFDPDSIVMNLTAYLRRALEPGKTLVFFDEIQECPNARTAIKFLVEDGRFDYIESGSLLGVRYIPVKSYPVGYEQILQMYPMDFEEFCVANGVQKKTFEYLEERYATRTSVSESVHHTMLELFRHYVVVGGTPAVVQEFVRSRDVGKVVALQNDILALYRQDVGQYAEKDSRTKIMNIFDQIPSQLDDKNRRFTLSSIGATARRRDYEASFAWLCDAGVALPCYNLAEPQAPLKINEQRRLFKLFMNDVGLLCASGLENVQFEILQGDLSVNMGSILENTFAQLLTANRFELRYLNKRNVGKLDFVVQRGGDVVPLEIKSGNDYKRHAALNNALNTEAWGIKEGIVFCKGNVERDDRITYLPWYLVMFFSRPDPSQTRITLDLSGV